MNSGSDFSKKVSISFIIVRIFCVLTKANDNSIALFLIETSGSFKHSKIVERCLCTADVSMWTVFNNVFKATYRIFLSLFNKKRPKMLTASTWGTKNVKKKFYSKHYILLNHLQILCPLLIIQFHKVLCFRRFYSFLCWLLLERVYRSWLLKIQHHFYPKLLIVLIFSPI